jgi:hypothetical protein
MANPDLAAEIYKIIKYFVLFGIAISLILLIGGSVLVRDTYYIEKNPRFFISETLVMGLLSSLPIIYISVLRKAPLGKSITDFFLLFCKVAFLHVGFQLSGVYSVLFPKSGMEHN